MSKRNAIFSVTAVLILRVSGGYGQEITMKRQEPTMTGVRMMKVSPPSNAMRKLVIKKKKVTTNAPATLRPT